MVGHIITTHMYMYMYTLSYLIIILSTLVTHVYRYVNSSDNDLSYWGLDYPPLTAYHSWLCGAM